MSDPAAPVPVTPVATGGLSGKLVLIVAGLNLLATTGLAAVVVLRGAPAAPVVAAAAEHGAAPTAEHAARPEAETPPPAEAAPTEPAAAGATAATAGASSTSTLNTARLEDIVVHLRNPEVDRYARLTIDVEMQNANEVKALQDNVPRVRDAVIMALSEHTFEELRGSEGLARMKGWLRDAIDDVVPGRVTNVYVSTFLVQ